MSWQNTVRTELHASEIRSKPDKADLSPLRYKNQKIEELTKKDEITSGRLMDTY